MPSFVQASAANTIVTVPETVDPNTEAPVTVVVRDGSNNGIEGIGPAGVVLAVSGTGNTLTQPTGQTTDAGESPGLAFESSVSEAKTITVTVGGLQATTQPSCTVGTTSDVFAMDYSLAAATAGGFTIGAEDGGSGQLTITRQVGIGPSSQNAYRYTYATGGSPGGQYGFGWQRTFVGAPFAYGDVVYLRFRYRINSGAVLRFYDDEGALGGVGRLKKIILNNGSATSGRPILDLQMYRDTGSGQSFNWRISKGGGEDPAVITDQPLDSDWHAVQLRVSYSSAQDVADGGYAIWFDNATEGSPDASIGSIVVNAEGDVGSVSWGAYQNNGLYSDGVLVIDQTDFAISTTFTVGWGA